LTKSKNKRKLGPYGLSWTITFPARKNINKIGAEVSDSKHILGDESFVIAISRGICLRYPSMEMGSIHATSGISKVVKGRMRLNFIRSLVGHGLDILAVEGW
jgi:hypothetical protein